MQVLVNIDPQDIPLVLEILASYILESLHPQAELKWMEEVGYLDTIEQLQLFPGLLPSVISFFENFRQFESKSGYWGMCVIPRQEKILSR